VTEQAKELTKNNKTSNALLLLHIDVFFKAIEQ
jgi:hypothetical protein